MSDYGVTPDGFKMKRLDEILTEVKDDLSEGWGIDVHSDETSFLNVLNVTFANQIAELWEAAQSTYHSHYPYTAVGKSLDNAVTYGGVTRMARRRSVYPIHCVGIDGTIIPKGNIIATETSPEVRLLCQMDSPITRESCNQLEVKFVGQGDSTYTIKINDAEYEFTTSSDDPMVVLEGLKNAITDEEYDVRIQDELLVIADTELSRSNYIELSENLTTNTVTSIITYETEEYGKIVIVEDAIRVIVSGLYGFLRVRNWLYPTYGRLQETDIELRKSYAVKQMGHSKTMIESIVSEILDIDGVESASGSENDTDEVDEWGLPPHSVEIIVEGGDERLIAEAILRQKAGGIGTYGSTHIDVLTSFGDIVPINFNRPEKLYVWMKVKLEREENVVPYNYEKVVKQSVINDTFNMEAGQDLIIQMLTPGIFNDLAGVTYVHIFVAYSTDKTREPEEADYTESNILASRKQTIVVSTDRIEVSLLDS